MAMYIGDGRGETECSCLFQYISRRIDMINSGKADPLQMKDDSYQGINSSAPRAKAWRPVWRMARDTITAMLLAYICREPH